MNLEPPSGSRISVTTDGAHPLILIPHGDGGLMPYYGFFLVAWLVGWLAGFVDAVSKLSSGDVPAFLLLWLIAWTLGGAAALSLAYRAFRPSVPESLKLMPNSVTYDSGIPPLASLQTYWGFTSADAWKTMFRRRTRVELDRGNLQSLCLRQANDGNRLTVDADALRLDIAQSASKFDREWLYHLLANRYSLAMSQPS